MDNRRNSRSKWAAPTALAIVLACVTATGAESVDETWAFEPAPDPFSDEAMLDLRHLNEAEAGETGWIRYDRNGDFIKGDGTPIRFWAVHDEVVMQQGEID